MRLALAFVMILTVAAAHADPIVRSTVAFRLDKKLIPENIALDPKSGAFFVGSMYQAKIVKIAPDGTVTDLVPSRRGGLLSVLGMKIDAERRELWAAAGNFVDSPPMEITDPATEGKGALFRFSLDDGRLIRAYWPSKTAQFNDLVVTSAGDVYTTSGPDIWRVRAGASEIEPFVSPGGFFNGIAITPDERVLFGASNRGIVRIDIASKETSVLRVPAGVEVRGIDGLYVYKDSLIGIQNGTKPMRVIRIALDAAMSRVTGLTVLEQDHPEWDLPLTGAIAGDHLYYVARSQLRAFEGKKIWPDEKLQDSIILKLPLQTGEESLLEIHRKAIGAHIERNADWLADSQADEIVMASRGKIHRLSKEDTRKFFRGYFDGATYPQYEDTEPPIVRVSNDGTMGWILSRTRVRRVHDGKETSFVYAGMMVYEKRNGEWVRVANASTFE